MPQRSIRWKRFVTNEDAGMTSLFTEIRQSARRLSGSPGYSAGVFVTLTLGLALSVGMYTVLKGVILNGLPYPGGERVVEIGSHNATMNETGGALTGAEALALVDVPIFEDTGWFVWGGETVLSGERPREITVHRVSAGYFPALGVRPQLGRWINADDIGPEGQVIVLSDAEWERVANRDPDIVGKPLQLAGETVSVVGVMPPEFATGVGFWLAANPQALSDNPVAFVNARYVNAVGRLAEGVEAQAAASALDALVAQVRDTHGLPDNGWRLQTTSLLDLRVGDVRGVLAGVFVVSLIVLAIACANVGSLLAARLAARERELAIIQALGATAARVWRSLLFELLLLALLASIAALLVLTAGLRTFRALSAGILPRADDIALDPAVLVFAAGLALLCVLLVGLPFGLRLRKRMAENLHASGKGTGGAARGAMRALPVAGLALATTALIAGTAVALSLDRLRTVDPGFRTDGVYAVQMFHGGGPDEWRRFANSVRTVMESEPDVEKVAVTTAPPLSLIGGFSVDVQVPGREQPEPLQVGLRRVTQAYLDVLSQPLLLGRSFLATDGVAAPNVAIVNETFARRVFGNTDVVGRDIGLPLGNGPRVQYRIVGIVADIRNSGLRSPPGPEILIPFLQSPSVGMTFLVHAPHAGDGLLERMQEAIWAVDPEEAMTRVYRLQDEIEAELSQVIFFTRMLSGFAVLAILLATFGTYSVIAFLQRRQTTETGVRLALGARPAGVAWRVLGQGLALAAFAGLAGSIGAVAVLRLLAAQLFGVGAASPALYVFGIVGVLFAALLASAAPAWRAARIQPMAALRYE
jgi:putative ABC transport system permease protein